MQNAGKHQQPNIKKEPRTQIHTNINTYCLGNYKWCNWRLNYQNEKAFYGEEEDDDSLESEVDEEIEDLDDLAGEVGYEDTRVSGYQNEEETDDDDFWSNLNLE